MYAVIVDSGSQFCVEEGQKLLVDFRQVEPGQTIEFDRVLLVGGGEGGTVVGQPTVAGAKVVADVLGSLRSKKVHVQTYRRRKNFRKHKGHRQTMTEIRISKIIPS